MDDLLVADEVPLHLLYGGELIRDNFSDLEKAFPEDSEDAVEEFPSQVGT